MSVARVMKDSGVAWIGEIPANWDIRRFKDAGSFQTGRDHKALNEGHTPVYGSSREPFAFVDRALCKRKAIAIGRKGTVDQPFIIPAGFWAVDTCMFNTAPKKNFSLEYLGYWAEIIPWRDMSTQTALPSLTQTDANNAIVGYPPFPEQRAADYIDRQIAQIDQRLATLAEKKAVLAELRKATIHDAVTKGLNKTAPMKDSENLFIGKIPVHWAIRRIKKLSTKIGSGKTPLGGSSVYVPEGVMFLRSQNVWDEGLFLDDVVYIAETVDKEMKGSRIKVGDILINVTGASIGRACLVPDGVVANVNQHVCIVRLRNKKFASFVARAMQAYATQRQIVEVQVGAAREGLNFEQIGNLFVVSPPPDEQRAIVDHLDQQTQQFDAQLATLDDQAQVLKELRKAIIHEAVTGKINLTDLFSTGDLCRQLKESKSSFMHKEFQK